MTLDFSDCQNLLENPVHTLFEKIRRGPKLEGCVFTNFGNSSGTEGESRHEMLARITLRVF